MFSTISSFQVTNTPTPLFTNPNVSLFPDDIFADDSSSSLSQSTVAPPDEFPPAVELADFSSVIHLSSSISPPLPLHRTTRVSQPFVILRDYICNSTIVTYEPRTYREASSNPLWKKAMAEELQALISTHNWDLVDLPRDKFVVGCKQVYKIKTRADGSIDRYKARLVAKGFTQEYDIDYEETFAPVARLTSVRSLIAIAPVKQWKMLQMDVKNAFLNGDLIEEVYMQPPPGYDHPPNQVCRLIKALYGLKQAPRAWFAKFSSTVCQFSFQSSPHDHALFIWKTTRGCTLLLLYINNMIITRDDLQGIYDLKFFLKQQFDMKHLKLLNFFLGLEVSYNQSWYYLSQAKYASDIVSRTSLTDSKTVHTPMKANAHFSATDGTPLNDDTLYRQLVGSLIHLTVTRPDIAHVIHIVSQFMATPRTTHFAVVIRILRYVKGTMFQGLHFSRHSSLDLRAFSDADWAGDATYRRSTTSYYFFLGNLVISWRSKK